MWWRKKPVVVPESPKPDPHPDKSMYLGKLHFAEMNFVSGQPWTIYNTAAAMSTLKSNTVKSYVFFVNTRPEAVRLVDYFDSFEVAAKDEAVASGR